MKKLIPLLLLVFLAGCATTQPTPTSYSVEIKNYEKELPKYPLKLTAYFQPCVENCQLLESEYNQYGTEETGYFRIAYGSIVHTKFGSAFSKMFREAERTLVADRETRLLEAGNKKPDLLCDIVFIKDAFNFTWENDEGALSSAAKAFFIPYTAKTKCAAITDLAIKVSFYKPDGSVILEKTYPYRGKDPVYLRADDIIKPILDVSNMQLSNGVDEIVGKVADDLKSANGFIELVNTQNKI